MPYEEGVRCHLIRDSTVAVLSPRMKWIHSFSEYLILGCEISTFSQPAPEGEVGILNA